MKRPYLSTFLAVLTLLGYDCLCYAAAPSDLIYISGSTAKDCQLTGDTDGPRGIPTLSQTNTRYGVLATDLGSSFEHKGKLYFLFGDTWGRPGDADALAWTTSGDPKKIKLDFYPDRDGKWLPITVPGISLRGFEIPSGGASIQGKMYVVVTTDWHPDQGIMGRSVLAVSEDDGRSFKPLYDLSTRTFINVSIISTKDWVYIFGSGDYRKSSIRVCRIKPDKIGNRSQLRYFNNAGTDDDSRWSPREEDATPLIPNKDVGEFSVAYCKPASQYVMLYNAAEPRGITMRSAPTPWGPWSEGTIIFDSWRDKGYGHFMHISSDFKADHNDTFSDTNREKEWGGEYGPYIMNRYTTSKNGVCRLYYTMSTWNPYQVVVMHSDFKLTPSLAGATK